MSLGSECHKCLAPATAKGRQTPVPWAHKEHESSHAPCSFKFSLAILCLLRPMPKALTRVWVPWTPPQGMLPGTWEHPSPASSALPCLQHLLPACPSPVSLVTPCPLLATPPPALGPLSMPLTPLAETCGGAGGPAALGFLPSWFFLHPAKAGSCSCQLMQLQQTHCGLGT